MPRILARIRGLRTASQLIDIAFLLAIVRLAIGVAIHHFFEASIEAKRALSARLTGNLQLACGIGRARKEHRGKSTVRHPPSIYLKYSTENRTERWSKYAIRKLQPQRQQKKRTGRFLNAHGRNGGVNDQVGVALVGRLRAARLLRAKAVAHARARRLGGAAVGVATNHALHALVVALRAIRAKRRGGLFLHCTCKIV